MASLWGPIQSNSRGNICIAQGLPSQAELIRLGNSYWAESTAVGLDVPGFPLNVQLGAFWLYNGEPPGGKSYLLDTVAVRLPTSTGVAQAVGVVGHLFTTNPFPVENFQSKLQDSTIKSLSGKKNYPGYGRAHVPDAIASDFLEPNEGNQHCIMPSVICGNTNSATLNSTKDVYGRYIIPPRGCFTAKIITTNPSVTMTGNLTLSWHEVQLRLGGG